MSPESIIDFINFFNSACDLKLQLSNKREKSAIVFSMLTFPDFFFFIIPLRSRIDHVKDDFSGQ